MNTLINNTMNASTFESIVEAMKKIEEKKVLKLVNYAIREGATQAQIIEAIQRGLDQIGHYFEEGKYGVTDLMMAGIIFEEVLKLPSLKLINEESGEPIGKILLCTIERDLHDIGKSIFKSAALMSNFEIIDMGINITAQEILEETIRSKPDVIAISSILAEGVRYIKEVNEKLIAAGIRDQVKIIVGGLSTHRQAVEYTGVDAFANDVYEGVKQCKIWITEGGEAH
ncbi:MAG: cobalamin B12-binding domain-containing protein [Acetobacterium woodii]|nr:cobalamin B12-binding domain-containing protein [Acetobacterium woodii]